jgi:hypothetical protein
VDRDLFIMTGHLNSLQNSAQVGIDIGDTQVYYSKFRGSFGPGRCAAPAAYRRVWARVLVNEARGSKRSGNFRWILLDVDVAGE